MIGRLVLGTAAFGWYAGRPGIPYLRALGLLDAARRLGMMVETAPAYGDAEKWVGDVMDGWYEVATKVPATATLSEAAQSLKQSCHLLRRDSLDVLLLHNAEADQLLGGGCPAWRTMRLARDSGTVKRIGVTVYSESAVVAAVHAGAEAIEVPYNLLDQRMGWLFEYCHRRGVKVWARSVWLRGALAWAPDCPPAVRQAVQRVGARLWASPVRLPDMALQFAADGPDRLVIGPRSLSELDQAVEALQAGRLPWWRRMLARGCASSDQAVYDPRRWGTVRT